MSGKDLEDEGGTLMKTYCMKKIFSVKKEFTVTNTQLILSLEGKVV